MKFFVVTNILILVHLSCFCQLYKTEAEIVAEYGNYDTATYDANHNKAIYYNNEYYSKESGIYNRSTVYYLNRDKICLMVMITEPKTQLSEWIKSFNDYMKTGSDSLEWIFPNDKAIASIHDIGDDIFIQFEVRNAGELLTKSHNFRSAEIKMIKAQDGTYSVPLEINGVLKLNFILDSGASDVFVTPDVVSTLIKTGTVSNSDFIGHQEYVFADGSKAISRVFVIKEIKLGNKIATNVIASISESQTSPLLLGQSVLQQFGKVTINNNTGILIIE